jgi:hypothetical protein
MDRGRNGLFPSRQNRRIESQQRPPGTVHAIISKELPGVFHATFTQPGGSSRAQLLINLLDEGEAQLSGIAGSISQQVFDDGGSDVLEDRFTANRLA